MGSASTTSTTPTSCGTVWSATSSRRTRTTRERDRVKFWERIEALTARSPHRLSPWYHGSRVALALILALATYAFFPSSPAVDFPLYEVGSVSPTRVVAPFAFNIPKDARELQRE